MYHIIYYRQCSPGLYFPSVTVAPTWLVTPPSQNFNWPSGKLQPPAEFLSLGHILIYPSGFYESTYTSEIGTRKKWKE